MFNSECGLDSSFSSFRFFSDLIQLTKQLIWSPSHKLPDKLPFF